MYPPDSDVLQVINQLPQFGIMNGQGALVLGGDSCSQGLLGGVDLCCDMELLGFEFLL